MGAGSRMSENGTKRTCRFCCAMSALGGKAKTRTRIELFRFDPGCVKTCTSRECAELFSLFSSFDGDCQSGSFVIQRNRDKLSTRKFDVGVFTQPSFVSSVTATL